MDDNIGEEDAENDATEDSSRISIGDIFTVKLTSGMVIANLHQEIYHENDMVATLFDTTGGRQELTTLEKDIEQTKRDLAYAKNQLSSLGIFAFVKKRKLTSRTTTLSKQQSELDDQMKALRRTIDSLTEGMNQAFWQMSSHSTQAASKWFDTISLLETGLQEYLLQLDDASIMLSALNNGEALPKQIKRRHSSPKYQIKPRHPADQKESQQPYGWLPSGIAV